MQQVADLLWLLTKLLLLGVLNIILLGLIFAVVRGFVWHFRKEKGRLLGWKSKPTDSDAPRIP